MLLLPHSSHLYQPLDVGVFRSLKHHLSSEQNHLLRAGVSRLEKAEWMECFQKAHPKALTISNIQSGWRASGIHPLSLTKALGKVPNDFEQTNENTDVLYDAVLCLPITTKGPIASPILKSIHMEVKHCASTNIFTSLVRRLIPQLIADHERVYFENKILKREVKEYHDVLGRRKERKIGKRAIIKDVNVVSKPDIVERIKAAEESSRKKKACRSRKHNSRKKKEESKDESDDEEEEE